MERLSENKLVLVTRKTRLDDLVARFNTITQAQFYVEHLGADFTDYVREHSVYQQALTEAHTILSRLGRVQRLDRALLPNFLFGPDDTVVAIGQDGLVANTLKYLTRQPLIGVNPDSHRWDGVLLPFSTKELRLVVTEVFKQKRPIKEVTLAEVALNDGQKLLAVNDFFIGQKGHVSARYTVHIDTKIERQSSSGIIVSTGLGSTGWMKSILIGASQLLGQATNSTLNKPPFGKVPWDADYLLFSVREPFPSKTSAAGLVFGKVTQQTSLKIRSEMAENGIIFSDGIESDYLSFNSGLEATIAPAGHKGQLVV